MALPPEIKNRLKRAGDKVKLQTSDGDQVVVEGKTTVPFNAFVKLILKRKVQSLFKDWQEEPVIVSSELLTRIASAPEDSHEDTSKLILTAMTIGLVFGLFIASVAIVGLGLLGIEIGVSELLVALVVLLLVACAVYSAAQIHSRKIRQQVVEKVEQVADVLGK